MHLIKLLLIITCLAQLNRLTSAQPTEDDESDRVNLDLRDEDIARAVDQAGRAFNMPLRYVQYTKQRRRVSVHIDQQPLVPALAQFLTQTNLRFDSDSAVTWLTDGQVLSVQQLDDHHMVVVYEVRCDGLWVPDAPVRYEYSVHMTLIAHPSERILGISNATFESAQGVQANLADSSPPSAVPVMVGNRRMGCFNFNVNFSSDHRVKRVKELVATVRLFCADDVCMLVLGPDAVEKGGEVEKDGVHVAVSPPANAPKPYDAILYQLTLTGAPAKYLTNPFWRRLLEGGAVRFEDSQGRKVAWSLWEDSVLPNKDGYSMKIGLQKDPKRPVDLNTIRVRVPTRIRSSLYTIKIDDLEMP